MPHLPDGHSLQVKNNTLYAAATCICELSSESREHCMPSCLVQLVDNGRQACASTSKTLHMPVFPGIQASLLSHGLGLAALFTQHHIGHAGPCTYLAHHAPKSVDIVILYLSY